VPELTRYWFHFEGTSAPALQLGCGVTAHDYDDAIGLIRDRIFKNKPMPRVREVIEDIDLTTLDAKHILPNTGIPVARGVWFPLGWER
jgi:hypothetical protein